MTLTARIRRERRNGRALPSGSARDCFDSYATAARALAPILLVLALAGDASAICDVIPQVQESYRGALGSLDRPYAMPGDSVQIGLDLAGCDSEASPGFPSGGSSKVLTIVYTPPNGPRHAAVFSKNPYCTTFDSTYASQCLAQLGTGATVSCTNSSIGGDATTVPFGWPATSQSGPAKIAISSSSAAPPCQIATQRCADTPGLFACIDDLYEGGTCQNETLQRGKVFSHFTALPQPNSFAAACTAQPGDVASPCLGTEPDLRFTTDVAGNALIPIDWTKVLVPGGLPVPRLVEMAATIPAFAGSSPPLGGPGDPIRVPGSSFLSSHGPRGHRVPPIFQPLSDANKLFGSADAARGVVRIARRSQLFRQCAGDTGVPSLNGFPCNDASECGTGSCGPTTCRGGSNPGAKCASDLQCLGGGECGPTLFEFRDRYSVSGLGPVLVTGAQYDGHAENPVAIDGLIETDELFVTVRSELLEGAVGAGGMPVGDDINDDGDATDPSVLTIRDKATGDEEVIGLGTGPGRAIARVRRRHPFTAPALAAESDVVAFLEAEALEGDCALSDPDQHLSFAYCDKNDDGDSGDAILRIYRQDPGGPVEVSAGQHRAADADPLVNDRSLAVSNGRVFYRESEADGTNTITVDASPLSSGTALNASIGEPRLSSSGRHVAFSTAATNLRVDVGGPDTNGVSDVFVYDRDTDQDGIFDEAGATRVARVSLTSLEGQLSAPSFNPSISADGRYVAFDTTATPQLFGDTNGVADVYVWDRDADGDGVYDEGLLGGGTSVPRVSVDNSGNQWSGASVNPSISADGNRIAFETKQNNPSGPTLISVRDRALAMTSTVGGCSFGCGVFLDVFDPAISADGNWVAYAAAASSPLNLVPPSSLLDTNNAQDIAVAAVSFGGFGISDTRARISLTEDAGGNPAQLDGNSIRPTISGDGRYVGFVTAARNVPEPTDKAYWRFFVRDRDADEDGVFDEFTQRNALALRFYGRGWFYSIVQLLGGTMWSKGSLSASGRRIGLEVMVGELTLQGYFSSRYASRFDGLTGLAGHHPDSLETEAGLLTSPTARTPSISADGLYLGTIGNPGSLDKGAVVLGPDAADLTNDLSGDGDHRDTVLAVWDAAAGAAQPAMFGPARRVEVANGNALLLVPESEVGAPLNGDGDEEDEVVHLYLAGQSPPATTLGVAAREVAISPLAIAVLVSEAEHGAVLNGDGLQDDVLVGAQPLAGASAGGWTWLGAGSSAPRVVGSRVAWTVRESEAGNLNGDADATDTVLLVYDVSGAQFVMGTGGLAPRAVFDFALGDEIVAFRVDEAGQGAGSQNGDSDTTDGVMQLVDLATEQLVNTDRAATPCPMEACDPLRPYRVKGRTVSFLIREAEQFGGPGCLPSSPAGQCDLDGNGNPAGQGLVLQHYNALASVTEAHRTAGASVSGVCTDTGSSCASDAECPAGRCVVPPGGCIRDLGTSCNPEAVLDDPDACALGEFCVPLFGTPTSGTCHVNDGPCSSDLQCSNPAALCSNVGQDFQRIADALEGEKVAGETLVSAGLCIEATATTCTVDPDCPAEHVCTSAGTCGRPEDTCLTDADCRAPATCELETIASGDGDLDGDGVADAVDVCPGRADPTQADLDADGIGDACDRETCGNAIQEYAETCDDGDQTSGDGCSATCAIEGATPACSNGLDDDGDGAIDYPFDAGCTSASDASERQSSRVCDDGIDNDGDYRVDFATAAGAQDDPGCTNAASTLENPQCSNGIDDDNDGKVDFDGGGFGLVDPQCTTASKNKEKASSCGLGFEIALALAAIFALVARRRGTG